MKWMYISDVHVPYEDKEAVEKMFEALKAEKPDELILGGDIVDFYKISRYDHSPLNPTTLKEEVDTCIAFLKRCRKVAGKKCKITFIEGNHENRLSAFINKNAPEFAHFEEFTLPGLLKMAKFDIEFVCDNTQYWIEDFLFRHGHELFGFSAIPGASARKGINAYNCNYIQGHIHKGNIIHVGNTRENYIGVENPCLSEMTPGYMKGSAQWQQGWTIGELDDEDKWQIRQTIL